VTFNNRCGLGGDFSTPEYTTNANTVTKKWESNRGLDPFSFGYNYLTPDSGYLHHYLAVNSVYLVSKA
jgi:alpha-L-fucosidase